MKRQISLAVIAAAVVLAACAIFNGPARVELYAQAVPATLKARWDPNPATDNVTEYRITLNGGAPIVVAPTLNAACSCIQQEITIPAFGAYTVAVVAVNQSLSTDPTSAQVSDATNLSFTLSPPPGLVKNGKITK